MITPAGVAPAVLDLLRDNQGVTNVVLLRNAAIEPPGHVIMADVAREAGGDLITALRELALDQDGSIAIETVDTHVSDVADRAIAAAPGLPSDALVWEEVESRTSEEARLSFTYAAFMVIAVLIAAVGIITDSPILIVGAMVVGPEFGPIAGLSVALVSRRRDRAVTSLIALAAGFTLAVAVAAVGAAAFRGLDLVGEDFDPRVTRPLTGFISDPDAFSVVVASLAGVAGMLSLTSAKSGALIGVLISVTTVPAAADVGVSLAFADWSEARGAAVQLVVNLLCLVAACSATLLIQRRRGGG